MHERSAHRAAFANAQPCHQAWGVHVSVAHGNVSSSQLRGNFGRWYTRQIETKGRHTLLDFFLIFYSVDGYSPDRAYLVKQCECKTSLVFAYGFHGPQKVLAIGMLDILTADARTEFHQIFNRCMHARDVFVNERTHLDLVRWCIRDKFFSKCGQSFERL